MLEILKTCKWVTICVECRRKRTNAGKIDFENIGYYNVFLVSYMKIISFYMNVCFPLHVPSVTNITNVTIVLLKLTFKVKWHP